MLNTPKRIAIAIACNTTTIAVSSPIVVSITVLFFVDASVLFVFDIKISFAEVLLSAGTSQGCIFYISSAVQKTFTAGNRRNSICRFRPQCRLLLLIFLVDNMQTL